MQLIIQNIKKDYGKIHALSGISITFTPGLYGLLGPNGAGKSTLINLITDNIARQDGEILFDGTDIKRWERVTGLLLGTCRRHRGFTMISVLMLS